MSRLYRVCVLVSLTAAVVVVACTPDGAAPAGPVVEASGPVVEASEAAPEAALEAAPEWVRAAKVEGRDPFAWKAPEVVGELEREAEVDLGAWRVTGIVTGTSVRSAILVGPGGESQFPREGETFLRKDVRVREIRDGEVEFTVGRGEHVQTVIKSLAGAELANAGDEVGEALPAELR